MAYPWDVEDFPSFGTVLGENGPFNATYTVTLGELREKGYFAFETDATWNFDSYDATQETRLWTKFLNRYYWREIAILPLSRWKMEVLRKLNEVMPKYKLLYAKAEAGINIFQDADEYSKGRSIYSDFPQTALGGNNEDYATNGSDTENETVKEGNQLEQIRNFERYYNDVDVMVLNELELCFCQLLSTHANGY